MPKDVRVTDETYDFEKVAEAVSNWTRWGPTDQLGTLNFVDAKARLRAAQSVVSGEAFSLALPLSREDGIQIGFIEGRINPKLSMFAINNPLKAKSDPTWICSSEDTVELALQCATHWDALAHISHRGKIWNNVSADTVNESGATVAGIHNVTSLVSRGILLDVAKARGVDHLEPGYPITRTDLDAALQISKAEIQSGDLLLIRTGHMVHLRPPRDLAKYTWPSPGLTIGTAQWFYERNVGAVATDTLPCEVFPCENKKWYLPVHILHLVYMGMLQGQNWVLDDLAAACNNDGRYTFLLDASPLPITRGLGGLLNPVAVR